MSCLREENQLVDTCQTELGRTEPSPTEPNFWIRGWRWSHEAEIIKVPTGASEHKFIFVQRGGGAEIA